MKWDSLVGTGGRPSISDTAGKLRTPRIGEAFMCRGRLVEYGGTVVNGLSMFCMGMRSKN